MRPMADLTTEGTGSAERKSANRSACATTRMGIYGRDPITDLELYHRPPAGLLAFGTARVRTWGAAGCAPTKKAAQLEDSPCATGLLAVGFGI